MVIVGSPNVNTGYKLVNNQKYPQIAQDYERTWSVLKSLPCDIFLGAHGSLLRSGSKICLMKDGAANPFIDPADYKEFIAEKEQEFRTNWQSKRSPPGNRQRALISLNHIRPAMARLPNTSIRA